MPVMPLHLPADVNPADARRAGEAWNRMAVATFGRSIEAEDWRGEAVRTAAKGLNAQVAVGVVASVGGQLCPLNPYPWTPSGPALGLHGVIDYWDEHPDTVPGRATSATGTEHWAVRLTVEAESELRQFLRVDRGPLRDGDGSGPRLHDLRPHMGGVVSLNPEVAPATPIEPQVARGERAINELSNRVARPAPPPRPEGVVLAWRWRDGLPAAGSRAARRLERRGWTVLSALPVDGARVEVDNVQCTVRHPPLLANHAADVPAWLAAELGL